LLSRFQEKSSPAKIKFQYFYKTLNLLIYLFSVHLFYLND